MVQKSGVHQLRLVVYPTISSVLAPSQVVIARFPNHQQQYSDQCFFLCVCVFPCSLQDSKKSPCRLKDELLLPHVRQLVEGEKKRTQGSRTVASMSMCGISTVSIYPSIRRSIYGSISFFLSFFFCLFVYLSIYLSIYLSTYLIHFSVIHL